MQQNQNEVLKIAGTQFKSRLFSGTGKFSSPQTMLQALQASGTELVTLALKRVDFSKINSNENADRDLYANLKKIGIQLLPNTSGAKTAEEAIMAAQLSREAFQTNWLKLEIHPDPRYLMPDPIETLKAAEALVERGFVVMPYCHADPVLAKRLEEVGCAAVMPLGSPIGSNAGLASETFLKIIIEQAQVPVVVDAGIGAPSDAALAMELGADAVLVNTAIAAAGNPIAMARAFRMAVEAGYLGYQAGLAAKNQSATTTVASASSPLTAFLDQSA